ncbi:conserved hypothetical protein [Burkholderiales bacterium]|nr:conserved hypothetical protein [Burkholderiales bacterium]
MNTTPGTVADPGAARAATSAASLAPASTGVDVAGAAELRFAPDDRWWPAVAALVRDLCPGAGPAALCDLRRVVVIVPRMLQAPALRAALHGVLDGAACIAPRVLTLEAWAQWAPGQESRQRAELLGALRDSAWVRDRFGAQAAALWSLARDIARLSDELTLAACGAVDAFEGRWQAAVQRNFSQRAAAAGDLQAQLVLALWRAGLAGELGTARLREQLERCAQRADGPLVWLAPQGAAPWQRAFCRAYAAVSGQRACLVEADPLALAQRHPWLAAAWPELTGSLATASPIAKRAGALAAALPRPEAIAVAPPLQILKQGTLEEESSAAASWVVDRLHGGCRSIALIALDRLTARRVRALLDRVQILVADEAGWKLSTTSAAAAVMRWLDVVISDFQHRELLDWLRSPFTLADRHNKAPMVASMASALLEDGVAGGMQAVRTAVVRRAHGPDAAALREMVDQLVTLAHRWQRPGSLGRFLGLLAATLDGLGMRPALAADPVGRSVLEAVEQLSEQLSGSSLRLDLVEFRAFLAGHFEELFARDREIESPVVMTTLAGTRLRRFDAALLIGADADHLPAMNPSGGLLASSIRRDLGLRTEADSVREQTLDLACLLATTPSVAATWRCRRQDEPVALSPLLDRIDMLMQLAGCPSVLREAAPSWHHVPMAVGGPRSVRAPDLLPGRISASAYQDLVDCPYRFFALRMLGLREAQRLRARPDKRDFGLLLHAVLLEFHGGRDRQGALVPPLAAATPADATPDPALAHLHRIVDALLAPLLQQRPALIGYRQRLRLLLPGYLHWLRQSQKDGWRWQAGEVPLKQAFALDRGPPLELEGRIDRIDEHAQGRRRMLDYKARDAASLRKAQKEPGEVVQLLFYGLLLEPPVDEAGYLSVQRPPDLRNPSAKVVTLVPGPAPLAEGVSALRARLREDLDRIAAGASLPANGAEPVCRRCELRSLCRHGFTVPPAMAASEPHE